MIRRRLPNRRPAERHDLVVGSARYAVTIGLDELGRPRELFIDGPRIGSDMDALLDDVAVTVSIALQHGVPAAALAASMGRSGSVPAAVSIVGAALNLLAQYERGDGW